MLGLVVSWAAKCSRGNGTHPPFGTERTTVLTSAFFIFHSWQRNFWNFLSVEVWGTEHEMIKGWLLLVHYPMLHTNRPLSSSECFGLWLWCVQRHHVGQSAKSSAFWSCLCCTIRGIVPVSGTGVCASSWDGEKFILQRCILVRDSRTK